MTSGQHDWQTNIESNLNSCNLRWKQPLSSCALQEQMQRQHWHQKHLQPWVQLPPIHTSPSDAGEQLEWCSNRLQKHATVTARRKASAKHIVQKIDRDLFNAGMHNPQAWT